MPEGPSIVIAKEELQGFVGKRVIASTGNAKFQNLLKAEELAGMKLLSVRSWGKHLILTFDTFSIRIHFLMFGSYRVNEPKTHLSPRLELQFYPNSYLDFYTCSIRVLDGDPEHIYDWSGDLMSDSWDPDKALNKIKALPGQTMICDILMDQNIFAGLGNIMKNEILYRVRLQPETTLAMISLPKIKRIISEARTYALQFYEWKKIFQLKKHWEIMRQRTCPKGHKVTRKITGQRHRISFFCEKCQKLINSKK